MKKSILIVFLIWILLGLYIAESLADIPSIGEMSVQIDNQKKINYPIRQALIYRRVTLAYDTTAFVQSDSTSMILVSPQFNRGENNVLRIIFGNLDTQSPDFYDFLIILGETLKDTISWKGDSSLIFLSRNGLLQSHRSWSKDINGQIIFSSSRKKEIQSGVMKLEFDLHGMVGMALKNHFNLNGTFELLVGDYRDISLGQTDSALKEKERKRQNIYWALIISAFLIAIFGIR